MRRSIQFIILASFFHLLSYHSCFPINYIPEFGMHFSALAASGLVAYLFSGAIASPSTHSLSKRCTNSADDRSCWGNYDLSTNYYDEVPDTGATVEVRTPPRNHNGD